MVAGRRRGSLLPAVAVVALSLLCGRAAWAVEPLVADLSSHLIAITTGFAGTDLLLFGAIEELDGGKAGDVVVVVRGPKRSETLRHKARSGGIWVNSGAALIDDAPSFYRVAATRPLDEVAPPAILRRHQIGLDHLDLAVRVKEPGGDSGAFRRALLRLMQQRGLYGDHVYDIGMLSHRLFRTDVHFPANVPVGTYAVEVYLIANGKVISFRTTPLTVRKAGVGAAIYDFAHSHAAIYGIIAILLAAAGGWTAAVAFRKV